MICFARFSPATPDVPITRLPSSGINCHSGLAPPTNEEKNRWNGTILRVELERIASFLNDFTGLGFAEQVGGNFPSVEQSFERVAKNGKSGPRASKLGEMDLQRGSSTPRVVREDNNWWQTLEAREIGQIGNAVGGKYRSKTFGFGLYGLSDDIPNPWLFVLSGRYF